MSSQTESSEDLLKQVVRLLGILVLRGMPDDATAGEKVLVLHSAGLPTQAIVDMTGLKPKTVANRVSEAKSAAPRKNKSE